MLLAPRSVRGGTAWTSTHSGTNAAMVVAARPGCFRVRENSLGYAPMGRRLVLTEGLLKRIRMRSRREIGRA
jgi:hypothetical protein